MYVPYNPKYFGLSPQPDNTWIFRRKITHPFNLISSGHGKKYLLNDKNGKEAESILKRGIYSPTYRFIANMLALGLFPMLAFMSGKILLIYFFVMLLGMYLYVNYVLYKVAYFCRLNGTIISMKD